MPRLDIHLARAPDVIPRALAPRSNARPRNLDDTEEEYGIALGP
jgi:hypothetical protein